MSGPAPSTELIRLRAEFDQSFTVAPPAVDLSLRDFVIVRTAGCTTALPAADLRGIEHQTSIVPVPSSLPSLLGIAGIRSEVVPIFSLGRLLGLSPQPGTETLFALIQIPGQLAAEISNRNAGQLLGMAFEELVHFARIPQDRSFPGDLTRAATIEHQQQLHTVTDLQELVRKLIETAVAHPSSQDPSR